MKKNIFLSIIIIFVSIQISKAQDRCYIIFRKHGIINFENGKYDEAANRFSSAKQCGLKPKDNDIATWVKKTENCIFYKMKGDKAYASLNYSEATDYYEKLLNENPKDQYPANRLKALKSNQKVNSETRKDTSKALKNMILVKGGTFEMGDNNGKAEEQPAHSITLDDFYIDKYEVSYSEFAKFLNEKGNKKEDGTKWIDIKGKYLNEKCRINDTNSVFTVEKGFENHPVAFVSWYGATAYATWKGGRLPTEAEWEYAAMGGLKTKGYKYSGSDNAIETCWFTITTKDEGMKARGLKKANELGIYDMSGNVSEWCLDVYDEYYYENSNSKNPQGPESGEEYCLRGGSWLSNIIDTQTKTRNSGAPEFRISFSGFRIVILY